MNNIDTNIDSLSKEEIIEALETLPAESANTLDETIEDLKAMGIRDINDVNIAEAMGEAMKNIQIQRTLHDIERHSTDKRSPRDYLEHHVDFLVRVSPGKTKADIINKMTLEHAMDALKITAKMDIPEAVVKKHLKVLKKKYC